MKSNCELNERTASIGLMMAALFWGLSYPLTKYVESCPTFYIISLRFAAAALFLAIAFHRRFRLLNKDVIKYAFLLSFAVFLMFAFGTWGIKYTTSVRSSFFTTLSFLMIPELNWIFFRVKISKNIVISALICLLGMFLLCYAPGMAPWSSIPVTFSACLLLQPVLSISYWWKRFQRILALIHPSLPYSSWPSSLCGAPSSPLRQVTSTTRSTAAVNWPRSSSWAYSAVRSLSACRPIWKPMFHLTESASSSRWSLPPAASCRSSF